jgi:proline iminopeptidase
MPAMDQDVLAEIQRLEAAGDTETPHYMSLLSSHYEQHVLRMPEAEMPEPVRRSFAHVNRSIYVPMQGPSELGASGILSNWDRTDAVEQLEVPTLVIGATYDTMDPAHMEMIAGRIPHGRFLLCHNGSHMAMYDDQVTYFRGLIDFIIDIDHWSASEHVR